MKPFTHYGYQRQHRSKLMNQMFKFLKRKFDWTRGIDEPTGNIEFVLSLEGLQNFGRHSSANPFVLDPATR